MLVTLNQRAYHGVWPALYLIDEQALRDCVPLGVVKGGKLTLSYIPRERLK